MNAGTSAGPVKVWPGVVQMNENRYRHLAQLAGTHLVELRPYEVRAGDGGTDERCAIYIATNHSGHACYAGQTRPQDAHDAAARRLRQHRRAPSKADEWRGYWVIPLDDRTTQADLNRIEREICARLGLQVRNTRWRKRAARTDH